MRVAAPSSDEVGGCSLASLTVVNTFLTLDPSCAAAGSQERRVRFTPTSVGEDSGRIGRELEESDLGVGGIENAVVSPIPSLLLFGGGGMFER